MARMGTASPAKRRRRCIGRMIVAETTQRNVFAKRDSANWERGLEKFSYQSRTERGLGRRRRLVRLYLCPRGERTKGGISQDGIGVTHPSTHRHISSCRMLFSGCSNTQPSAAQASGTLSVLRGISPLSKRIGVKTLQAPLLGKERMAAGKEEVGERKVRCRI